MSRIALLSCVKSKRSSPAPARDLYTSPLFRMSLEYAQRWGADQIYILSAEHGLVPERRVLHPYEGTLNSAGSSERRAWAVGVLGDISRKADLGCDQFLLLAGERYAEFLRPLLARVVEPLRGLPLGERLRFLKESRGSSVTKRGAAHSPCSLLHQRARDLPRYRYPFDPDDFPEHGIYLLFERGETAHEGDRIVRVGTHTGKRSRLADRLLEHFENENKDRSIFRKNIGRALLSRDGDPYLDAWNLDGTGSTARKRHAAALHPAHQADVERRVSHVLRKKMSFAVLPEKRGREHLRDLEKALIGTVASCPRCGPSRRWLGRNSPDPRIVESGLWQVQHLKADGLTVGAVRRL